MNDSTGRGRAFRAAYDAIIAAPFGAVGLRCNDDAIHEIEYLPSCAEIAPRTALAGEAAAQLRAYLADAGSSFTLPLAVCGTNFQRRVWREIAAIPLGQSRSYGEIARDLGSAARAVGQACGANPVPIVIPCHRVVAASRGLNGGLGGFAHARDGFLLDVKRWLLRHEGALRG
jgi:methylated-DNA-[protein]-cysteine S-methyltransferase